MTATHDNSINPFSDLLQHIARRISRGASPLIHVGEVTLPDAAPQTTSMSSEMLVAWRALLGETGLDWQAEALTTARRGGGLALVAPAPLGPTALLLLVAEQLIEQKLHGVVLVLAPYAAAVAELEATFKQLNTLLGETIPYTVIDPRKRLPRVLPRVLITTPETLHQRLLRLHHRAWSRLWPELTTVVLPALDAAPGAVLGHMRWLLRRMARLRPLGRPPVLFTSVAPVADEQETVAGLVDALPPIVMVTSSRVPLTWALWQGEDDPIQQAVDLALALRQGGVAVQLAGRTAFEHAMIAQRAAAHGLSLAALAGSPARTLIIPGAVDAATLPRLAASGYRSVVLVTDRSVASQVVIAHPALATPTVNPTLPLTLHNSYVDSAQLRCAAEEQPLRIEEIATWEVQSLVERLHKKHVLAPLPGAETTWQPVADIKAVQDSYAALHPASASGAVVRLVDNQDQLLGEVDSAMAERSFYPGAAVLGGVVERWADDLTVVIRVGTPQRTQVERRTDVTVREQFAQRSLDGGRADMLLAVGRVVVHEHIVARRVVQPDGSVRRLPFEPAIAMQWSAPAVWIAAPDASPLLGEIVAGVVPLLLRCAAEELVPCADGAVVYFVEAHPGGRGMIEYVYAQFEALLHLAELAARVVRTDPLLKAAAQAVQAWMEHILMPRGASETVYQPPVRPALRPAVDERVATTTEITRRRYGRSRTRPARRTPQRELPPPPVVPATAEPPLTPPAQPVRVAAQPPAVKKPVATPRPARRSDPPVPPTPGTRQVPAAAARKTPPAQPPVVAPATSAAEENTASYGSKVLPTRREPPPFERPPFQQRLEPPSDVQPAEQPAASESAATFRPKQHAERKDQTRTARSAPLPAQKGPDQAPEPRSTPPDHAGSRSAKPHNPNPRRRDWVAPPEPPAERSAIKTASQMSPPKPTPEQTPGRTSHPPPRQAPPRREAPPPEAVVEASSDPAQLLAKARRLREQREAELKRKTPPPKPVRPAQPAAEETETGRFKPGDRVFCVPYGEGLVKKTRIRNGRELLLVQFAELGDLRIDPQVNAVRLIDAAQEEYPDE